MDGATEAQRGRLTGATAARGVEGWEVVQLGSKSSPAASSLPSARCTSLTPSPSEGRQSSTAGEQLGRSLNPDRGTRMPHLNPHSLSMLRRKEDLPPEIPGAERFWGSKLHRGLMGIPPGGGGQGPGRRRELTGDTERCPLWLRSRPVGGVCVAPDTVCDSPGQPGLSLGEVADSVVPTGGGSSSPREDR